MLERTVGIREWGVVQLTLVDEFFVMVKINCILSEVSDDSL